MAGVRWQRGVTPFAVDIACTKGIVLPTGRVATTARNRDDPTDAAPLEITTPATDGQSRNFGSCLVRVRSLTFPANSHGGLAESTTRRARTAGFTTGEGCCRHETRNRAGLSARARTRRRTRREWCHGRRPGRTRFLRPAATAATNPAAPGPCGLWHGCHGRPQPGAPRTGRPAASISRLPSSGRDSGLDAPLISVQHY